MRPQEGQQAHQLWEEAQKAFSLAEWAEKERLFQCDLDLYTRDLDSSLARVERGKLRSRTAGLDGLMSERAARPSRTRESPQYANRLLITANSKGHYAMDYYAAVAGWV